MKIITLFCITLIVLFFPLFMLGQESTKLLSCCAESDSEAKCTGATYCSACSNCSKCAYCNNGGSCGVCAKGSSSSKRSNNNNSYNSNKTNRSSRKNQTGNHLTNTSIQNNKTDETPDDIQSEYYNKTLVINAKELNLRSGTGTNNSIIQKLLYMQEVIFLAMNKDWVKVRVKANGKVGYVHKKYVLVK